MHKFLLKYIKNSINLIIFYTLTLVILWIIDMLLPYISGLYIDQLVSGVAYKKLYLFLLIFAFVNIIKMICKYYKSLISTKVNSSIIYQISNDLFQQIFRTEYKHYSNMDCGYMVDKINKDASIIVHFLTGNMVNFVLQLSTIIMCAIIIYHSAPFLCLIIFALLPVYVVTFYLNRRSMYEAHFNYKEKNNKYFSTCMEQLSKLSYIKRNVLFDEMNKRLNKSYNESLYAALKSVKIDYVFTNLNHVIIIIVYLCIVGIGGYKVSIGELSIGRFSIINTYYNMIIRSVTYFLGLASTYQDAKVSYNRINGIANKESELNGSLKLDSIDEVIVNYISVYNSVEFLKSFTYKFERGKIYGIIGKNGVGKTTLLNALVGLYSAEHSGSIMYNNNEIGLLDLYSIRKEQISYVEQEPTLFNMSVEDYLKFGCIYNEVYTSNQKKFLCKFDIEYLLKKYINENGNNLSGGEKQKLALVKALSKNSSLILLDEPSSALDKKSTDALLKCLNERKQDSIIILITHDPKLIASCDSIIELK